MDPVSHALLGRTLSRLDGRRALGPGSRAAFVLGALVPDIDIVMVARGWDRYLSVHPLGTHALIAAPVLAAAVAALVRAFRPAADLWRLWIAALAGVVIGHLAFDLASGSDMQLFWPMSRRVFGPHLLAMADLLAIAILLIGTLATIWRPRQAATATLAALIALLGVKAVSQWRAQQFANGRATALQNGRLLDAEAVNGSIWRWRFLGRGDGRVQMWEASGWSGQVRLLFERHEADDDVVERARALPVVRTWLPLARVPFVRIERNADRRLVLWSDLRDCSASSCGLSFGAEVDDAGRIVRQIVQVGGYEYRTPLP